MHLHALIKFGEFQILYLELEFCVHFFKFDVDHAKILEAYAQIFVLLFESSVLFVGFYCLGLKLFVIGLLFVMTMILYFELLNILF